MDTGVILNAARIAGFDDARIVSCTDDVCRAKEGAPFETKSILVLFCTLAHGLFLPRKKAHSDILLQYLIFLLMYISDT